MAGTIIRLLPLQILDGSGVQAAGSLTFTVCDFIDISQWREGQLVARAHDGTNIGAGASVVINLRGIDPSPEDPSLDFDLGVLNSGSVVFDHSTVVPAMQMQPLDPNFGLMARLTVTLNQPVGSPVALNACVSVDLVLKASG